MESLFDFLPHQGINFISDAGEQSDKPFNMQKHMNVDHWDKKKYRTSLLNRWDK